jgi:hypothetical protein
MRRARASAARDRLPSSDMLRLQYILSNNIILKIYDNLGLNSYFGRKMLLK